MSFDETGAQSIVECRELLNNVEMRVSLTFIANQFSILASTIEKLETRGSSLETAVATSLRLKRSWKTCMIQPILINSRQYWIRIKDLQLLKNSSLSLMWEIEEK